MTAAAAEITQSEDFIVIGLDGERLTIDVYEAQTEFAKIDVKYKDDAWFCFRCQVAFHPDSEAAEIHCPQCGDAQQVQRDARWLDEVAEFVRRQGAARCGRRAAARVYEAVLSHIEGIKKNTDQPHVSVSGTESTLPGGRADG